MQRYGERLFKPEAVPLVIGGKNLALDGLACGVAQFAEDGAVEPPFHLHGVMGEDAVFVFFAEDEPLSVDQYLGAWDIKNHSLVVSFL